MYADPVDTDLARHHAAMDADEAFDAWMADQRSKEKTSAQAALENPVVWDWNTFTPVLTTTGKVPYTAEEVLIEALTESKEARTAYAELMASPAAEKLRQLLAEHWSNEMWETRTACEISAAIREESEALND